MPGNIEIKAWIQSGNLHKTLNVLSHLADGKSLHLEQVDTFFITTKGRLKLREMKDNDQLVYYERSDQAGPKHSQYDIMKIHSRDEALQLKTMLGAAFGVLGTVEKSREVYMVDQTRIHIDKVAGLDNTHIEFEVVLKPGQERSEGVGIAEDLMKRLGVTEETLIQGSYLDLLLASAKT